MFLVLLIQFTVVVIVCLFVCFKVTQMKKKLKIKITSKGAKLNFKFVNLN